MSAARKILLLLCVVLLLAQGCAAHAPRPQGDLQPTSLQPVNGAEGELMFYAAAGVVLLAAFAVCGVVDLLSLPFAIADYIDYFFCCRCLSDLL